MPKGIYKRGIIHRKPHPEETRRRMSLAHKGKKKPWAKYNPQVFKKGHKPIAGFQKGHTIHLGKKHKPETIEKFRLAKLGKMIGEKHWNWKGGITPTRETIRKMLEYRQWIYDVFRRDDYSCQICGKKGGNLEVDHYPKRFAQILDEYNIQILGEARNCKELWSINNGRTLCENCHLKTYKGVSKKPWQR